MIAEDRKRARSPRAMVSPHLLRIGVLSAAILGVAYYLLRPGAQVGEAVRNALQTLTSVLN